MTNAFETQKYSKIAGIIKREIDQKYGNGWYVIVGKNFGTYVTHEKGSFMHFTFEDLHICVFRARWFKELIFSMYIFLKEYKKVNKLK